MTVAEMIDYLRQFDSDTRVVIDRQDLEDMVAEDDDLGVIVLRGELFDED